MAKCNKSELRTRALEHFQNLTFTVLRLKCLFIVKIGTGTAEIKMWLVTDPWHG